MVVIPKVIAKPHVAIEKWKYNNRFLIIGIIAIIVIAFLMLALHKQTEWAWIIFLFIASYLYNYIPPFNKQILEFYEEVTDTGKKLKVKKDESYDEICYDNISNIYWEKSKSLGHFIVIDLKAPSNLGKQIWFYGWGNDDEVNAWIERLNHHILTFKGK